MAAVRTKAESKQEIKKPSRGVIRNLRDAVRLAWSANPRGFVGIIALTTLSGAIPPAVVGVTKIVVDQVHLAITRTVEFSAILPAVLGLGFFAAAQRALGRMTARKQEVYSEKVAMHAEDEFLQAVAKCDAGHFDNPAWHDRVERAQRDISNRPGQLMQSLLSLAQSFVTLVGMGAILLTIHPLVLALAAFAAVVQMPFQRRQTKAIYSFYYDVTADRREMWYLRWVLMDSRAAKELRAFNLQSSVQKRFNELRDDWHKGESGIWIKFERFSVFAGLIGGIALAVAYGFVGLNAVADESFTAGSIAALIGALAQFGTSLSGVAWTVVSLEEHATFLNDYFAFLSLEKLLDVPEEPTTIPREIDSVEFDSTTFSYPGMQEKALAEVNLRIRKGELIALVGDNGAGKTTMVKLLCRFYDPTAGSVKIGGVDLRQSDPSHVRSRLGILFQDAKAYPLSAREGVTLGRPEADGGDEAVWTALRKARAEDLVRKLPKGLDNYVGRMFEGGRDLSGGEWQRLALARLMYRDADIWILDEPTASLDPETEAEIFAELKANLKGRIGIVISHRFSTVRVADRIAVVEGGRITELGTHNELMAKNGRYAYLFNLQASGYR